MKAYSFAGYIIDGKESFHLDIYKEHNTFTVYEHDVCVFRGAYSSVVDFINEWHEKQKPLVDMFASKGLSVEYKQGIA